MRLLAIIDPMHHKLRPGINPPISVQLPLPNLLIKELIEIESLFLSLSADPQMHVRNIFQRIKQHTRNNKRVSGNTRDLGELFSDLEAVAVDASWGEGGAVEGGDGLVGEDAGEEGAGHAAYAVEFEDVEAFVYAEPGVDVLAEGADYGC